MDKCCEKYCKRTALALSRLTQHIFWEIEAEREIKGKSFIKPNDLERICYQIDRLKI